MLGLGLGLELGLGLFYSGSASLAEVYAPLSAVLVYMLFVSSLLHYIA